MRLIYILISSLLIGSCSSEHQELKLSKNDANLNLKGGITYYNGESFSGLLWSNHKNGTKKSEQQFLAGKKHGSEMFWYEDGTIQMKRYYTNGRKSGKHEAWYPNGNLKFIYPFNLEGAYHGNVREWYSNGLIYRDFNYENGKEQGSQKLWTELGKIKANYDVIGGERFGLIGLKTCKSPQTELANK